MRLSTDVSDAGYNEAVFGKGIVFSVDGVIVENVITADEDGGHVICLTDDALEREYADDEPIATERREGRVVINLPRELAWLRAA